MQKKLELLGWLNNELAKRGKTVFPVLAGMSAVQFFTNGACNSLDIDLLWNDTDSLTEVLSTRGYRHEGRYWYSEDENTILEVLGYPQGRKTVSVGTVKVLAPEEVVLDLLEGYVWTGSRDNYQWARVILEAFLIISNQIDMEYLRCEAQDRGIIAVLDSMFVGLIQSEQTLQS